jgi:hypothetical protein
MKVQLFFFCIALCGVSNSQTITFQKSYGSTYSAAILGTNEVSVQQTLDGGYIVGGTISANNGDIYLMKINASGDTLWTKTFGGNLDDVLYSVRQTSDSGYIIVGQTRSFSQGNSDAYVLKTDANGNLMWSKNYGGFDWDFFSSAQQTNDNGFILCGTTFSFGSGIMNIYLVKIDLSGNFLWMKTLGGDNREYGTFIQQTSDHGFIITGSTKSFTAISGRIYLVKTDSLGNPLWSKIFGGVIGEAGNCVKQCSDGGYIITGYTNSFGAGGQDVFLVKTDLSGNLQWMKTYGGAWIDEGYYVEQTTDSGFIVTGRTQSFGPQGSGAGGTNIYLLKTDANGDTLWTKTYGSVINNGYCVKQTNDGGYVIASNPTSINLIKTDSKGNSGCNQYSTNTITNNVSPMTLTGCLTNSGGNSYNAATITRHAPISINTLCSGSNDVNDLVYKNEISIYPNPFSSGTTIKISGNYEKFSFTIYNLWGQSVKQIRNITDGSTSLSRDALPSGLYFIHLMQDDKIVATDKLVITDN